MVLMYLSVGWYLSFKGLRLDGYLVVRGLKQPADSMTVLLGPVSKRSFTQTLNLVLGMGPCTVRQRGS